MKPIIYQVFPRIFTNTVADCEPWGSLKQNGAGKMNDFTPRLLSEIKELGVSHLWLTGIIECATKTAFHEAGIPADNPNVVKGEAGSPYAIKDYYDVCPAIATVVSRRMEEFESLVGRIHDAGMKVLIDFVPNHTARSYHSDVAPAGTEDFGARDDINYFFRRDNNYYYITSQQFSPEFPLDAEGVVPYVEFPAKATGNDCFTAFCGRNDWYETVKLNYGVDYGNGSRHFVPVPDTWRKMLDILNFWVSKGVDGFRCDMVFMVPLEFWNWVIPQIKTRNPHVIFIGEIYDVGLYRPFLDYGCFDYLYDKVNLYDTLVGIECHNVSAARLTGCWQTVDGLGPRMLNFLENHDEVRFGSRAYAGDPSRVMPSLVVSSMISTGPFMVYYGQELGESARDNEGFAGDNNRSTIFDYWSYATMRRWYNDGKCDGALLSSQERWLRNLYGRVLRLCNESTAISKGGFFDLMYVNLQNPGFNPHSLFAFIRHSDEEALLIVANFSDSPETASINIPAEAFRAAGISPGPVDAPDLLNGQIQTLLLMQGAPACVRIAPHSAVVLRIRGSEAEEKESTDETVATKAEK